MYMREKSKVEMMDTNIHLYAPRKKVLRYRAHIHIV
jgi:hypothetical protein